MSDETFLLYGTLEREQPPRLLQAGRLSAKFADGNLKAISYDGVEVLRAISYIVRDRDWGTYSPSLTDLKIDEAANGFTISYRATCAGPAATNLDFDVKIFGSPNGLTFSAVANSSTGFETNRCGFCILHPIVGVAGSPVQVEHVDGTVVDTHLPDLIEPWQPFKDMRAITHRVLHGVSAECRMEGDTFEMEDQRNWSDASYKTYVRPLALPWPYRVEPNLQQEQTVTLTIRDDRSQTGSPPATAEVPVVLTAGTKRGKMPTIGVVIRPEDATSTLANECLFRAIGAQELLFHFDPLAEHGDQALLDFARIAERHSGATAVEIALPCKRAPAEECMEIAAAMKAAGFSPRMIMISPAVDRQSTPPGSEWPECPPLEEIYEAAHAAFADKRVGGGMLSYFTELNRKRVPPNTLAFISHCTNPIVHAADDVSVMQTLEALPFITRSVRAIYGDKPYRIGPSTIPMRQNPYGSRTMENPDGGRIPMANRDPRHNGRFAEAFAFGYAISVLDAAPECLTLSALTGSFGLVAADGEPTPSGQQRPVAKAITTLASRAGEAWQEVVSSAPSDVLCVRISADDQTALHVVNLTPVSKHVDASAFMDGSANIMLAPYEVKQVPL